MRRGSVRPPTPPSRKPYAFIAFLFLCSHLPTTTTSAFLRSDSQRRHPHNLPHHQLNLPALASRQRLNRDSASAFAPEAATHLPHSVRHSAAVSQPAHPSSHLGFNKSASFTDTQPPVTGNDQSANVLRHSPNISNNDKANMSLLTVNESLSEEPSKSSPQNIDKSAAENSSTSSHDYDYDYDYDLEDERLNMTNFSQLQILRNEFRFEGGIVEFIEWLFVFLLIAPGTFPAIGCVMLACANAWRRRFIPIPTNSPSFPSESSSEPQVAHTEPIAQRFAEHSQSFLRRSRTTEQLTGPV